MLIDWTLNILKETWIHSMKLKSGCIQWNSNTLNESLNTLNATWIYWVKHYIYNESLDVLKADVTEALAPFVLCFKYVI